MLEFDARKMMSAASATAVAAPALPGGGQRRQLSPEAQKVAAEPLVTAYSPIVLAGFVRMLDAGFIAALGVAIHLLYVFPTYGFEWYYLGANGGIAALAVIAFQAADIYDVHAFRSPVRQITRLAVAWTLVFLIAMAVAFFAKFEGMFSRVWLAGLYLIGLVGLIGLRLVLAGVVRHWTREGRLDRRAVVVGGGEAGESLIEAIKAQRDTDVHVVGVFDDRGDDRSPMTLAGRRKLGTVDDLVEFARRTRIDLVIFSLPISAETRILQMLKKLWVLPVDIRLAAHSNKLRFRPRSYSYIGNVPVLDVFDKPITDWDVVMKWLFDKFVGSLLLLAAAPILALTALASSSTAAAPCSSSRSATASTTR
jgi:FlaA1/EpsC-like NDP-sugar epimerase